VIRALQRHPCKTGDNNKRIGKNDFSIENYGEPIRFGREVEHSVQMLGFDLRMSLPDDDLTDVTKDGMDDLNILPNIRNLALSWNEIKNNTRKISTICYIRGLIILLVPL
jgi:hypothetical protein